MKGFVWIFLLLTGISASSIRAQQSIGGLPWGLTPEFKTTMEVIPVQLLNPPNIAQLKRDDERNPGFRFAAPILTDLNLDNSGGWTEMPNGDRFWTLKLMAPGALSLAVLYDDFYLPSGSRLYMYNSEGTSVLGAYTPRNNSKSGRFLTGFIPGDQAIIEYYEPASERGQGSLRIFRVEYAYADTHEASQKVLSDFGTSWSCHLNAVCTEADSLSEQRRSTCRIMMVVEEGMGYCSGTLMNNTANDGKPYVLSAFHCMDGYTPLWDLWRFDFNYQSSTCNNPSVEPAYQSVLGCDNRAGRRENDFLLLELFYPIPPSFQAFFAGWDRSTAVPMRSAFFHHPLGDIKKVTIDSQAAVIQNTPIQWNNQVTTPTAHHFKVLPDRGTFQVSSSGAGLFNQQKRIVGQLHGGLPSCDSTIAYFGRLALSWNGGGSSLTRLRDWLNPQGTDTLFWDGIENPNNQGMSISGTVKTENNMPIPGVKVWISGISGDTVITDASGSFVFESLSPNAVYTLGLSKNTSHSNGVTTMDMVRIQRQILSIESLGSPYKQFAADVNRSNGVSTLDLVLMRRLILSIANQFPDVESWQFFPANYNFEDPENPFPELTPNQVLLGALSQSVQIEITGIKTGDVNGTANPGN